MQRFKSQTRHRRREFTNCFISILLMGLEKQTLTHRILEIERYKNTQQIRSTKQPNTCNDVYERRSILEQPERASLQSKIVNHQQLWDKWDQFEGH